jgi:glycosyltransferase involved in cell wall biosynthesis
MEINSGAGSLRDYKLLSVVIPMYNEEENIQVLYDALKRVLDDSGKDYEILFVNDGCHDRTPEIMNQLAGKDKHVRAIHLSRNFGHQPAVSAGLSRLKGDIAVVMDADMQDPPELIPALVEEWRKGYEVVYAIRAEREGSAILNIAYKTFYRLLNRLSDIHIPKDTGDFSLIGRRVVDRMVNDFPENVRFLRGIRAYAGYKQTGIPYSRPDRYKGVSKYNFKRMMSLALDGWFGFSTMPLRIATYIGLVFAIPSFLIGLLFVLNKLFGFRVFSYPPTDLPGVATLAVATFFIGGVTLIILGVIGEYLARIYLEVKKRPNFIIAEEVSLSDEHEGE